MELPTGSLIIIAFLVSLVVLTGVWKASRGRQPLRAPGLQREGSGSPAPAASPVKSSLADTVTAASPVQVDEISILDEVDIYLSYGHLEQAATSLSWYVDHNPDNTQQRRRLLAIYREIPDIDHFAELLEQLIESHTIPDAEARDLVLQGLKLDPQNLQLRVTAENLGMGGAQIAAVLAHATLAPQPAESSALAGAQRELQQAIVNPEPLDLSGFMPRPEMRSAGVVPKRFYRGGPHTAHRAR